MIVARGERQDDIVVEHLVGTPYVTCESYSFL